MKRAFSILLIIAIMAPSLIRMGILIDFKINQDFIAKVLCINRDKPDLNCNGKCHLTKQLKIAEEPENKQAPHNARERCEIDYFMTQDAFKKKIPGILKGEKAFTRYASVFLDSSFIADIFHPPRLISISL